VISGENVFKWLRITATIFLALFLLHLAMRGVRFSETWHILKGIRWYYLAAALALNFVSPLIRAWRWRELFDGEAPGFWLLVRAVATGQTLNLTVPFRTGEVARVLMIDRRKLDTAGTVAVEKLMDTGFFAALCLMLPFFWVVPKWLEKPRLSVIAMAGVYLVVVGLIVIMPWITRLPRFIRIPPVRKIPFLFITTLLIGIGGVVVNDLVIRCLGIQTPFMAAVVLLVILQAGVAVPSTPGKVGVFQYLAVLGLSLFGVGSAPGLAFGVIMHLLVFLPTATIAAAFFLFAKNGSAGGVSVET
jgi:glycosyltransferase 2 family protein